MRGPFAAILIAGSLSWARAGTLIPVIPPGLAVGTRVIAINDDNTIAGSFIRSDGIEQGFVGPLNGTYTTFSDGNGTEAAGLSNSGYIVGLEPTRTCLMNCSVFVRSPSGKFTTVTKHHNPLLGRTIGINKENIFVGEYLNHEVEKGYRGRNGRYVSDITIEAPHNALFPSAINDKGEIAGFFLNDGVQHGFLKSDGVESVIKFPSQDAKNTLIWGLNNKGIAVGDWADASGNNHPFYFDSKTGVFTEFTVRGSASNVAKGVNSSGLIAVYTYPGGVSYIYCPQRLKKCPGDGIPVRETRIYAPRGQHYPRRRFNK